MSPVKEADPQARSLDAAFAEAMGAPAKPKDPPAPKEIDPGAPHGRDDQGQPIAPYGFTQEGKPRRSAAGRKSNEDKARTAPPQPDGKTPGKALAEPAELGKPGEFVKPLSDTADTGWFALSAIGKVTPGLPLVGGWASARNIPAKISATAAVWLATKDRAVAAFSLAAEHNASAANLCRKLKTGDITWMITCISLVAPIASMAGMVWSKDADEQLQAAGQPTLAELAAGNDKAMQEVIAQITTQAAQAAEAEMGRQEAA